MKKTILCLLVAGTTFLSGQASANDCTEKPRVSWGFSLNLTPNHCHTRYESPPIRQVQRSYIVHHFPVALRPPVTCACYEDYYIQEVRYTERPRPVFIRRNERRRFIANPHRAKTLHNQIENNRENHIRHA